MTIEQFAEQYEKRYQKLERYRVVFIIVIAILVIGVTFGHGFLNLKMGWVILILTLVALFLGVLLNVAQQLNANIIAEKWMNDLDTDFALGVYRKLTEKTSLYMEYIMPLYFNLLCLTGNYEELEEKYTTYIKEKNKVATSVLHVIREVILSQMENQSLYAELIFEHKFSKYYGVEGELSRVKATLRSKDEQKMVQQLMFRKEYEKAIEEIDRMNPYNRYLQMWGEIRKQKCLYYLGRENEIYLPDAPEWMLRTLKYLLDTGEEYFYEDAEKWINRIEADMPQGKKNTKKAKRFLIVATIVLCFEAYYFSVEKVESHITEERYEEKLKENGIFVDEIVAFEANDDFTIAVIHGKSSDQNMEEQYYFAAFDYYRKWFVKKEELKLEPIGRTFENGKYYVYEGDKENYISFLSDEAVVITYKDEWVWDKGECRIINGETKHINAFRIEEDFEEQYVKISTIEEPVVEEVYEIGNNHYDEKDGSMYAFYDVFEGWELRVIDSASGSRWYKLDYTTDGGKTWETINEDPFAGEYGAVEGIAFYWRNVGYISISKFAGEYARVFFTEDGGYTFEEIVLPVEECEEMNAEDYQYYSMPEVSDEEIRITVRESRNHKRDGYVFSSKDRGKTWEYAGKVVDEFYYDKEE